ncbi:MAG: hypothetical protein OIN87_07205 [Candidatus Methanoperedens sp.]|nr:hypothetical protein [Candidatus Methanoperedens sp.]
MDRKKSIKYGIILLLIVSISGYYVYQHALEMDLAKPAVMMIVSTNLSETGTPMVNNVTIEEIAIPFFYKTADSIPKFPEVDANIRLNTLMAPPASYWASAYRYEEGEFPLKLFFREGSEPKAGDILIITIRLVSGTGAIQYKTTAFHCWQCEE